MRARALSPSLFSNRHFTFTFIWIIDIPVGLVEITCSRIKGQIVRANSRLILVLRNTMTYQIQFYFGFVPTFFRILRVPYKFNFQFNEKTKLPYKVLIIIHFNEKIKSLRLLISKFHNGSRAAKQSNAKI